MSNQPPYFFPFEDFVAYLRQNGFVVGVHSYLRLQRLLNQLDPHTETERLRSVLCPIFASTPDQQQQFYYLFDTYFAQFPSLDSGVFSEAETTTSTEKNKGKEPGVVHPYRGLIFIAGIVGSVLLTVIFFILLYGYTQFDDAEAYFQSNGVEQPSTAHKHGYAFRKVVSKLYPVPQLCDKLAANFDFKVVKEGNRFILTAENVSENKGAGKLKTSWLIDGERELGFEGKNKLEKIFFKPGNHTLVLQIQNQAGCVKSATKNFQVSEPLAPSEIEARFVYKPDGLQVSFQDSSRVPASKSTQWKWNFGDGKVSTERNPVHQFKRLQSYSVSLEVSNERNKSVYTQTIVLEGIGGKEAAEKSRFVPTFPALLPVADGRFPSRLQQRANRARIIRWAVVSALALIVPFCYLVYRRRRRNMLLSRTQHYAPPYLWQLQLNHRFLVFPASLWGKTTTILRKREAGEQNILDIPSTVQNTIQSGGFINFQYKPEQRPVEYLFLVDKMSHKDHQATYYKQLAERLSKEDIYIDLYYYNHNFEFFWQNTDERPIELNELIARHPKHRLVVVGDGDGLLDPQTGDVTNHIEDLLTNYQMRALMSTRSTADWGLQENTLNQQFMVIPANLNGFFALGERLERRYTNKLTDWMNGSEGPLPDNLNEPDIEELKVYLGLPTFRWLAACAVYPELEWELTVALGQALSVKFHPEDTKVSEGKYFLLEEQNICKLIRLPYFRKGEMPVELREELLSELDDETELWARQTVVDILEENLPPEGSSIGEKYRMNIALQKWQLKDRSVETREAVETYLERNEIEDGVALTKMKLPKGGGLHDKLRWRKWWDRIRFALFRDGIPMKGVKSSFLLSVAIFLCVVILSAIYLSLPSAKQTFIAPDGSRYYLKNHQDTLDFWNAVGVVSYNKGLYGDAINAWNSSLKIKPFQANIHFNRGLANWQLYLNAGQSDPDRLKLTIQDFRTAQMSNPSLSRASLKPAAFVPASFASNALLKNQTLFSLKDNKLYRTDLSKLKAGQLSLNSNPSLLNNLSAKAKAFCLDQDGKAILVGKEDFTASLIDLGQSQPAITDFKKQAYSAYMPHTGALTAVALSPDKHYLATGGTDRAILLWDRQDQSVIFRLEGHNEKITDIHFSADNEEFISASADKTAIVWNREIGSPLQYMTHEHPLVFADFAAEASYRLTLTENGEVHLWDEKIEFYDFQTDFKQVTAAALTSDKSSLVVGGDGAWLRGYDWQGNKLFELNLSETLRTATETAASDNQIINQISIDETKRQIAVSGNFGAMVLDYEIPKSDEIEVKRVGSLADNAYKGKMPFYTQGEEKRLDFPASYVERVFAPYQLGLAYLAKQEGETARKYLSQIPADSLFRDSLSPQIYLALATSEILAANRPPNFEGQRAGANLFLSALKRLQALFSTPPATKRVDEQIRYLLVNLIDEVLYGWYVPEPPALKPLSCSVQDLMYDKYCSIKAQFDELGPPGDNGFVAFRIGKLWGYLNQKREIAIEPRLLAAQPFQNGLAWVKLSPNAQGKTPANACIDTKGKIIYEDDDTKPLSEGLKPVRKNGTTLWGYMDESNKILIPAEYDQAFAFQHGFAVVGKGGKFGFISRDNKLLGGLAYSEANPFDDNGIALVKQGNSPFLIDRNGQKVENTKVTTSGRQNLVSDIYVSKEQGQMQPKSVETQAGGLKFEFAGNAFDGLRKVRRAQGDNYLYAYVDANSQPITGFVYTDATDFSEGLAGVKTTANRWGFIDKNGVLVIPPTYSAILQTFKDGKALVQKDNQKYYIDRRENCVDDAVFPCISGNISPSTENKAVKKSNTARFSFQEKDKWGIVNAEGNKLTDAIYENEPRFVSGVARVRKDGKWGIVRQNGRELGSFDYDEIGNFEEGLAPVRSGKLWGYIDLNGNLAIPLIYAKAEPFAQKMARVSLPNGRTYYINSKGAQVANDNGNPSPLLYNIKQDTPEPEKVSQKITKPKAISKPKPKVSPKAKPSPKPEYNQPNYQQMPAMPKGS